MLVTILKCVAILFAFAFIFYISYLLVAGDEDE